MRSGRFPLVRPLPSTISAAVLSALFDGFFGTTRQSDFPLPFVIGVRLTTSRCGLYALQQQTDVGSPGSRTRCLRTCLGSLTAQGLAASRHSDAASLAFRHAPRRRHPEVARLAAEHVFRGSIPSLHVPLSTLRLRPYERQRMTRGQRGWLDLHCMKFSFTTPRRFGRRTEQNHGLDHRSDHRNHRTAAQSTRYRRQRSSAWTALNS